MLSEVKTRYQKRSGVEIQTIHTRIIHKMYYINMIMNYFCESTYRKFYGSFKFN